MKALAAGKFGLTVAANHRLSLVGSDNAVVTCVVPNASEPAVVSVASV
jgi:hypothetical protein